MSRYLIDHFVGTYRVKAPYDSNTNNFPTDLKGNYSTEDLYLDGYNGIRIYHYGRNILQCYIPSLQRGNNIMKALTEKYGSEIIFNVLVLDKEVEFKFKTEDIEKIATVVKLKTSGASISPFSSRNLPKTAYAIPDEDLVDYKKITADLPKEQLITLAHMADGYLKSLTTKKYTYDNIKSDMRLKGLSGKNYIHSIGKWNEYIKYITTNLNKGE